jgi:aspartate/methionine/tyrosine aminotransferase
MSSLSPYAAARVRGFGTSIFSEMTRLATEHNAVNLSQGFPDFPGPPNVKQAAIAAIEAEMNQYAPSHGLPRLRNAIAAKVRRRYGLDYNPDTEVTVVTGATEGGYATISALVEAGDEVIIFQPFYDSYPPNVMMAGGSPRYVTLHAPDWHYEVAELEAAFSPRTKAIIVNTPHNPTGKVYRRAELEHIASLCLRYDVIAITDEVYEHLLFDDNQHISLATLPGMRERTVTLNSTGKTFSMTGWKIGYITTSAALTEAIRRTHQFITFCTATPFQAAMAAGIEQAEQSDYYAEYAAAYTARLEKMTIGLQAAGLTPLRPQGTFFVMADTSAYKCADDVEFARFLTAEVGVACIPPSAFYADADKHEARHLARFCFAKTDATLNAAAERLRAEGQRRGISR